MKTTISNEPIKVLLIEDDEDDYLLTRDLFFELKSNQYQLEWISNYIDGLKAVVRNEHHVCLIDYRLGARSGVELISKAQEQGCQIPMILLTGQNAHDIDIEAMSSGAADYLVKGQTNAALFERTIRYAVNRRQTEEKLRESEERLKAQYKGIPVPTYTWRKINNDFVLTDCNDAAEKITHGNISRIVGVTLQELYGDRPEIINNFNRCFNTKSNIQDDTEFQFKSTGEIKQLDVSYVFISPDIVMVHTRDVTDQKRIEASLRLQKTLLESQSEASIEGILVHNSVGKIISRNRRFAEMWGFSEELLAAGERELILRAGFNQVVDRRGYMKLVAYLNLHPKEIYQTEIKLKSGRILDLYTAPVIGANDFHYGRVWFFRDITEHKQIEYKLRQSEEKYRELIENANDIIYTLNLSGGFTSLNRAGELITGYTRAEVLTMNIADVISPDKIEPVRERIARNIAGAGLPNFELEIITKNDNQVTLDISSRLIYQDGAVAGIQGIGRDITGRKQAEAALLEANEKAIREYERLLERIARLAGSLGSARDLQTIYRALYAFSIISLPCTGFIISLYNPNQEMRIPVYACSDGEEFDVSILPPIGMTDSPNSRAISSGTIIIENDFQKAMVNKPIVNVGLERSPHLSQSCMVAPMSVMGRIVGAVEVQSTERASYTKEHATAMQMAANLAANAIENVRLLEQEREKDEKLRQAQKLESVGRLAGGIAHDFNNMLTAINGYSDLTLRRLDHGNPLRRNIEEIKKAGERSASLTHQLLAFSRQQILQPKILDINEVIVETIEMLKRLIGEDIHLITNLTNELSCIKADPGQLTQVIMNLLVNARDAMPKGGNLTIETKNVYLDEDFAAKHIPTQPGSYILLSVKDTGIGMTAEAQKNIFEPFYTTKEIGKGTGLGLATVYGIIKQSEGYIWVDSEVDKGTTFQIYLPPANVEFETKQIQKVSDESAYGAERILLVEDEEIVRNLSREMLETCGYEVIEASSGVEALEIFKQTDCKIDLLLTDIVMPQMGGRELAENLVNLQPQIKVIFTSGYTDDSIVRHGVNESDINFIQKPFTFDNLTNKIRDVLDTPRTGN